MTLKIRFYLRLITAFFKKFSLLILLGLIIGVVFFLLISLVLPRIFKNNKVIGMQGRFDTTNLPSEILSKLSTGLTNVDENGNIIPAIAQSWETSDNGKTWVFKLKEDSYWQDGSKIKSSDINYSFSDLVVEHPDDNTVVFKLTDNYSLFPYIVAKPVFKKGLLGNGGWTVKKVVLSGNFIDTMIIQNDKREVITYKFFPTEDLSKTMFKLGKVDELQGLFNANPLDTWNMLKIDKNVVKDKVAVVFFNTQDPVLADKSIRQAMFYAINKNNLPGNRAFSPISPDSKYYNPQVKKYDYNLDRAIEIINDLPDEQKSNLEVSLVTTPTLLNEAETISKSWNEVGVNSKVLVSSVIPEDFQAYFTILDIPKSPDQYTLWHSTQEGTNISRYASPRIDKLLEEGRKEMDEEKIKAIYFDFQRFVLEDVPAAFLYHPEVYDIRRK